MCSIDRFSSAELFPTEVRNVGLGAASMAGRLGGILCPYLNLLAATWTPLPLCIYGGLALTGGCMALLLPETLGKRLPETVEDEFEDCDVYNTS